MAVDSSMSIPLAMWRSNRTITLYTGYKKSINANKKAKSTVSKVELND
jgi:hypothetical protein